MTRHYLDPYGGHDASDRDLGKLFREHLPGRRLGWVTGDKGLPIMFAGNVYQLRVDGVGAPPAGVARVAARTGYRSAAAVVLVVEEYLRFARDPPAELLACAALCWAEDLVRPVKGWPLRSRGDLP